MSVFPFSAASPVASEYRKLVMALAARAARIGAHDPESAAQEAMKRSLLNPLSRPAVEYYFRDQPATGEQAAPEWSLLQLLGWLHGVLRFVVLEERARSRREVLTTGDDMPDVVDPADDPLQRAIDAELRAIVDEALATLSVDMRAALRLRLEGTKYSDIAKRLGVSENTVATWLRRGSLTLVEQAQRRMSAAADERMAVRKKVAGASRG
jgi:RNA polymerase sigma factor (sigma-70 family)